MRDTAGAVPRLKQHTGRAGRAAEEFGYGNVMQILTR
jgi:hypothetical protein